MVITDPRPPATLRRRRGTAEDPLRKVTMRLSTRVTEAVRAVVEAGGAPSADAFVEAAVVAALRERRRVRLYEAYAEAAQDPRFMADMAETTLAFDATLADGGDAAAE